MTEFWRLSATELTELIHKHEASALEITKDALARLDAVNPKINAVVADMPQEALDAASKVDETIAHGEDPGILAGAPVTVKVNIDQKGFATTNGLQLQRDLIAKDDSPVVSNLRKAGAIIVGRTNTPAFSLRWFTRNSVHGHTRNPRDPAITPGGSSGGAAAAVTAGIGAIGHGTDIGGSIRYPAYACGVHGLRPTLGRIPAVNFTSPDRHIGAQLMAVSGPIARTVNDLRIAFEAMSAEDIRDPWWTPVPKDKTNTEKRAALTMAPEGMEVVPEVEKALRDSAQRLENAGWTVDEVECPPFREPAHLQAILWLSEFRRSNAKPIADENDPDASFVYAQMDALCAESDLSAVLDALQQRVTLTRQWQLFLDKYPVLICPVSAELPFPDLLDVESPESFKRVIEAQLTQIGLPLMGLPGLTVSTDMVGTVPVGVQLVAGRFQENLLLDVGEVIEQGGTPTSPIDPVGF
ncbi:MAG: amidase family protein [Gammaproteobacteria bacterium]|nr:amidase family protein [Gammaproteobacteria bacterium]